MCVYEVRGVEGIVKNIYTCLSSFKFDIFMNSRLFLGCETGLWCGWGERGGG